MLKAFEGFEDDCCGREGAPPLKPYDEERFPNEDSQFFDDDDDWCWEGRRTEVDEDDCIIEKRRLCLDLIC